MSLIDRVLGTEKGEKGEETDECCDVQIEEIESDGD
ncbi:hypothetical protein SAMN05444422_105243 [Halobiforma haloterrestris]|uniref:Uncharacterized protein n=1 Tax=Natronobacterium haloterrestre TaxID=148448 RepID=A0A1I1H8P3_NATHA|nr:hypothetical protein SAMN05444422_105243 [Halobiforma haloterrestris]